MSALSRSQSGRLPGERRSQPQRAGAADVRGDHAGTAAAGGANLCRVPRPACPPRRVGQVSNANHGLHGIHGSEEAGERSVTSVKSVVRFLPESRVMEGAPLTIDETLLLLGGPGQADPGVLVGYRPGRTAKDPRLILGADAKLRAGTIIYGGSIIGARLETGHNVVIREDNALGDDV